jgi:hypothetical protein
MVDAHHLTPAEADQGSEGGNPVVIRPYIKDTDFRLGRTKRCVDDRYEGDSLLEQEVVALGWGDGGELVVGGGELDSLAGEGVEGFEDETVAAGGEAIAGGGVAEPFVEEECGRDSGMVEERDGEFADVEIPVRMAGPFEVEGLAVIEGEWDLFADELVDDGAVVDAANGNEARAFAVGEAPEPGGRIGRGVNRLEGGDVNDADTKVVGSDVEVGEGFLLGGIDVDEDDGFRIVAGDDGAVEELPIAGVVEAAEEIGERRIEREGRAIGFANGELKSEDRGEGLHLDEARGQAAVGLADEAEIGSEEMGMGVLRGGAPGFGNCGEGAREVGGIVDQLEGELGADGGHFVDEQAGKEAGSFRDGEGDVGARDGVEGVEHGAEGFGLEAGVEVVAEGGNHRGESNTGSGRRAVCERRADNEREKVSEKRAG